MTKFFAGLSAVFFLAILAMAYQFIVRGSVTPSEDGRMAIQLSSGERDMVLTEMRGFLESVQTITSGLAENDMKAITTSARAVGMANAQQVPGSLMGKLPLEFKTLGMATHQAFDALAMEAQDMGDTHLILTELGRLLNNCTTCHAAYQLEVENVKQN